MYVMYADYLVMTSVSRYSLRASPFPTVSPKTSSH